MESELGTSKVRVCVYIDEDAVDMTKTELLQMVNELHDRLQEKVKTRNTIARIVGFGR